MKTVLLLLAMLGHLAAHCPPECQCECACCNEEPPPPVTVPWPMPDIAMDGGNGNDGQQEPGYVSSGFTVTGGPVTKQGWVSVGPAYTTKVGTLVALTGESGSSYWTAQSQMAYDLGEELRALGWDVVQVRWFGSWWRSNVGVDAGVAALAGAPAAAIEWVADNYDLPTTEFVVAGNSGGSAQGGYALSHYGLDTRIDRAALSSGPPFAALSRTGVEPAYYLNSAKTVQLDKAHGFWSNGPFATHDASYVPRWQTEEVAGGPDMDYPTDLRFIFGENDATIQLIATEWTDKITSPKTVQVIPNMGHKTYESASGIAAVRAAILGQ